MSTVRRKACERCWRRKQKCDRLLPVCTNCAEADVACTSRNLTYAPAPDQIGLAIERGESYIGSLKRKIDHLQALRANKEARLVSNGSERDDDRVRTISEEGNETATTSQADSMENQHSRETLNEFGSLVLTAMAEPGDHDIISALSTTAFLTAESGGLPKVDHDPIDEFLEQSQCDVFFPHQATAHFLARFRAEFDTRYSLDYDGRTDDHNLVVSRHNDRDAINGDVAFTFAFIYLAVAIGMLVTPRLVINELSRQGSIKLLYS